MNCQLSEIRYSLNGISESQMKLLFSQLDHSDSQIIIKRLTDRSLTLSPDDLMLEGMFRRETIASLSRAFPPPLSFKVEVADPGLLRPYCGFEWQQLSLLFCGVSLLPFGTMQQMIGFENAWQYMRLLTTTEVGSLLRPWLAVKPKGLVSASRNQLEFVLPMHRIDFLIDWLEHLMTAPVDPNWLSGTTGEVSEEYLKDLGALNQAKLPALQAWVERTSSDDGLDFKQLFSRAMIALSS